MLKPKIMILTTAIALFPLTIACSNQSSPTSNTSPANQATPSPASSPAVQNSPNPVLAPIDKAKDAANTVEQSGQKKE